MAEGTLFDSCPECDSINVSINDVTLQERTSPDDTHVYTEFHCRDCGEIWMDKELDDGYY